MTIEEEMEAIHDFSIAGIDKEDARSLIQAVNTIRFSAPFSVHLVINGKHYALSLDRR